jgi:hypothetical protein
MEAVTMDVDKQRIAAVRTLGLLGYTFIGDEWKAPDGAVGSLVPEADAMHGCLVRRAHALVGCTENSPEEQELEAIVDAIEAYEAKSWPEGKIPGGKG